MEWKSGVDKVTDYVSHYVRCPANKLLKTRRRSLLAGVHPLPVCNSNVVIADVRAFLEVVVVEYPYDPQ